MSFRQTISKATKGAEPSAPAGATVYLGRQAIFDEKQQVAGYELLYRDGTANMATFTDPDDATCQVAFNAVVEIGLDHITGGLPAFFNVTSGFLRTGRHRALPAERVVLEILETEQVDDRLIETLTEVKADGFRLALDDFVPGDKRDPLVDLADIVKVDVQGSDFQKLSALCSDLRRRGVLPLAEKVSTAEEFETLWRIGFSLFQGFFFERPAVARRETVAQDRLTLMRLYAELQRPDLELADAVEIIRGDVGLTYRMLRLVNSAAFGLVVPVDDVRDAVVLLGLNTVRNVTALASLAGVESKPTELAMVAMIRAKMCQLLATKVAPASHNAAFTVGILSVLDAVFDTNLATILDDLPLTQEVRSALEEREGRLGDVLSAVLAYEHVDLEALESLKIDFSEAVNAYRGAVHWAEEVRRALSLSN